MKQNYSIKQKSFAITPYISYTENVQCDRGNRWLLTEGNFDYTHVNINNTHDNMIKKTEYLKKTQKPHFVENNFV